MVYAYSKTSKRIFFIAVVVFVVFLLARIKYIIFLFRGGMDFYLLNILILQIIVLPGTLLIIYKRIKKITITSNHDGLVFDDTKRRIQFSWSEIDSVKRTITGIRVRSLDKSFSFFLILEPQEPFVEQRGQDVYRSNLFRDCALLQEIKAKAKNAKFTGFPDGAF